jgi:hypothetical protein
MILSSYQVEIQVETIDFCFREEEHIDCAHAQQSASPHQIHRLRLAGPGNEAFEKDPWGFAMLPEGLDRTRLFCRYESGGTG